MLLCVDVGNSQTVIGLFDKRMRAAGSYDNSRIDTGSAAKDGLRKHWRISTVADRTADEYAIILNQLMALEGLRISADIDAIVIGSVVPSVTAALKELDRTIFDGTAMILTPSCGIEIDTNYTNAREIGPDRIANSIGVFDIYRCCAIVVDFGTATTYDIVSSQGSYMGGAILPGIELGLEALFTKAAALGTIELKVPSNVLGRSTAESIQSGATYGIAAQVDGMCQRLRSEIGNCIVVTTGGLSELISPLCKVSNHHEPFLTLHGLRVSHERNLSQRKSHE